MKEPPRAAVLDVGCYSAHLMVVETSLTRPLVSHKVRLRLDRALDDANRISQDGIDHIAAAVAEVQERLQDVRVSAFLAFATSSVRDAANASQVVTRVAKRTGLELRLLSGEREARMSYTACRSWFGATDALAVLDIGGGTVELAAGDARRPAFARSLPLGARTLTRSGLSLPKLRATLPGRIAEALPKDALAALSEGRAVGCSKVFQQLAELTGSRSRLRAADLAEWIPRLAKMTPRQRAKLPGISRHRARQSLAGAVAAEALMGATGHETIEISPWSTKEGLLLNLLRAQGN
ncbi:MAG: exopolyphosphatase [Actinophytocola sp.]|uniref:Ppx/GppA phosphatase family protein n=1 Tax=Actinophytocola sp. TaxID=1872138 RepID=UPI003C7161E8